MANNDDKILKIGGALLLGWFLYELLKNKGKIYRCPRCNYPVDKSHTYCPNCNQYLKW